MKLYNVRFTSTIASIIRDTARGRTGSSGRIATFVYSIRGGYRNSEGGGVQHEK